MTAKDLFDLNGKVAIITGGSSGLGKQIALGFGELGCNIVVTARNRKKCEEVCHNLENRFNIQAVPFSCNVADFEQVRNMVNRTMEHFGKIDILVNNAGITWGSPPEEYPLEKWNEVMAVNVNGSYYCSREVGKIMLDRAKGKIINIASLASFVCRTAL